MYRRIWGAARLTLFFTATGLGACASSAKVESTPRAPSTFREGTRGERIEIPAGPEFEEIAALEQARHTGRGRLVALVRHADDRVRDRAALALGRLPYPEFGANVTEALCAALGDPVPTVRRTAAFALGQRGDPAAVGVLLAYRNDPDAGLRARVVEAAGRIGDDAVQPDLLLSLRDADLGVRISTAVATALWDPDGPHADAVDRALIDALRPYAIDAVGAGPRTRRAPTELAWRILYALSRREAELGRGAYLEYVTSPEPLERLFATRGLARITPDPEAVRALAGVLEGPTGDWRVSYEAAGGLRQAAPDPRALAALLASVENENAHVRAAVLEALGAFPEARDEVLSKLRRGLLDLSPSARVAALRGMSGVLEKDDVLDLLERFARRADPVERAGAAEAAAEVPGERAVRVLRRLAEDSNLRVATSAVAALGRHEEPEVRPFLYELLGHADNGVRLAAVLALRERPQAADLEALDRVYRESKGEIAAEVAFNALENVGRIGGAEARRLLERGLKDRRIHVRRVAHDALVDHYGVDPRRLETASPIPFEAGAPVPLPGRDYPRWKYNPMIELRTSRGSMVFELFPAEAPVHVFNFLRLAEEGHYGSLIFHRVVPDFVIQGGDHRGDGNGGRPWRGESLRQEFGPRRFVRGSLGMPRNEDPDSGGSQFFVTHRPTPHLDGRYTLFGQLRAGGEILDRIEVGDHILDVRLLR